MTIGKKLYSGFGTALLITLLMGTVAIRNIGTLGEDIEGLAHVAVRNLYLSSQINTSAADLLGTLRAMLLRAHSNNGDDVHRLMMESSADLDKIRTANSEFLQKTTRLDLRELAQAQIQNRLETIAQYALMLNEAITKGDLPAADAIYRDKLGPLALALSSSAGDLCSKENDQVSARATAATAVVTPAQNLSYLMIVLSIGIGIALVWIVRGISGTLQSSVGELREGAEQVAHAAAQVSVSSQSLAQGASEQAASLEETSASSEEINSMARKNTDNSRSTAELLLQSEQRVTQANRYLSEMVVSMDQITDSSGKISKIIKVIDEIAFQTNILALNAAVEAARAGEAGMGFAVVADEVRSLAQRSAQAAKDTASLIEDSIAKSSEGKIKVDQVALAIQAVTEDAVRVKVMVDEVSLGSEEQTRGIDQIGRAISRMEQVTQTAAASAEEGAASAEELNAQSEALKDIVARLQAMVGGVSDDLHASRTVQRRQVISLQSTSGLGSRRPAIASRTPAPVRLRRPLQEGAAAAKVKSATENEFPLEENFQAF